jgi:hypothetical protein
MPDTVIEQVKAKPAHELKAFLQTLAGFAVLALLAVGRFAWFTREWFSPPQRNRFAELWIYTCAGAGLLYLAQLWIKGTV